MRHLDDDFVSGVQPRAVDLREASGGERRVVEAGEELLDRLAQLALDQLLRALAGEARHLVLKPRQFSDHLWRQHVDSRRQQLPDLDEGGAEPDERVAQPRREHPPRLDRLGRLAPIRVLAPQHKHPPRLQHAAAPDDPRATQQAQPVPDPQP